MEIKPVVVEFVVKGSGAKEFVMGTSLSEILEDAKTGKTFGADYTSHKVISLEEAKHHNLHYFNDAYDAVVRGSRSYWIGSLQ